MYQTATVTGKRQLTIPADFYRKLGLSTGEKVIVTLEDKALKIESASDLVEQLAGSLPVPLGVDMRDVDAVVVKAKRDYLNYRRKRRGI